MFVLIALLGHRASEPINQNMTPEFAALSIGGGEIIIILSLLAIIAFQIWMVVDCAIHETQTGSKVAWILVILLVSCLGSALYYFIRKLPRNLAAKRPTSGLSP